jgi:hypothetical protein
MDSGFWDRDGDGKDDQYDAQYVLNRDSGLRQEIRDFVDTLWQRYEPYCGDRDFLDRVKREFNPLTWQMYVGVCLLEAGLRLEATGEHGPDIKVRLNDGRTLWIECVAAGPGDGDNATVRTYANANRQGLYRPPPDEKIELRITSSISEKRKQRDRWVGKGVIAQDDPFVIAISAANIPDVDAAPGLPRIVKLLYGLGDPAWEIPIGGGRPPRTVPTYRDEIDRAGRAPISRRWFVDSDRLPEFSPSSSTITESGTHRGRSAAIWSRSTTRWRATRFRWD